MKIEVWSDFTCPFCYIGKRKLELALQQFDNKKYVKIDYKSFQLDPTAKSDDSEKVMTMLMKKYGLTQEKASEMTSQICEQAERVGLHFQFENIAHTNTFNAHRLVKYAKKCGKEAALVDLLFQKYFTHNENIGKREVLVSLAKEIDLDESEVDAILSLNNFAKAVEIDVQIAREIGINGVPFFIFNDKYALSGAQPTEVFLNALEQLWTEEKDRILETQTSAPACEKSYCEGDDCEEE